MTKGVFNERFLNLVESLVKAIKEEVDLVKENKTNNPDSDHKGSVPRAAIKFVNDSVQKISRNNAKQGRLGSGCPVSCFFTLNLQQKCNICACGENCD